MSMRSGASVSQLLAVSSVPRGARMTRALSMRVMVLDVSHAPFAGRLAVSGAADRAPTAATTGSLHAGMRPGSHDALGPLARRRYRGPYGDPRPDAARARAASARTRSSGALDVRGAWKSQPWRRPAARCQDLRRGSRPSAAAAARRARPSTRGPPGWRRSGSNRRWPGRALLVLGHQRRGRHLRDHEAGIKPGLRRQERRQARQRRVDQHGDAPLRERADLADRQRDHVGREGHRLGVEVAARQHHARRRR